MPRCAGIQYLTNTKVVGADVGAKVLTTAGGDTITYEKLIVATGARWAGLGLGLPLGPLSGPAAAVVPLGALVIAGAPGRDPRLKRAVASCQSSSLNRCSTRLLLLGRPVTLADFKTTGAELEGVKYLRNVQVQ